MFFLVQKGWSCTSFPSGELDPNVLGDGGLTFLTTKSNGDFVVFESEEEAPKTTRIQENLDRGMRIIAIKKSCLKLVNDSQPESKKIKEISGEDTQLNAKNSIWKFK